jgi:hypothetical protein
MASLIDQYVAGLRMELDFDRTVAERLANEVEDHLREAAEADPAWPAPEAERRAIARFGLSREIAAQFATDAIDRQARRTWITILACVIVTFVAMRLRVVWLDGDTVSALAPLVDRYAFIAAIAAGAIGWLGSRRSLLAPSLCLAGLAASIAAGFVRADLFAHGAPLAVLLTAAGEILLIGLLCARVFGFRRQLKRTAALRGAIR